MNRTLKPAIVTLVSAIVVGLAIAYVPDMGPLERGDLRNHEDLNRGASKRGKLRCHDRRRYLRHP